MFYINITVYRTSYICSVHVPVCTLWFILTDSIFQGTICCLTVLSPLYTFSVSLKFLQYLYWHQFDEHVVICDCIVMSNTYCVMFFVWFVFVLCLVCPMLPISLDCPFLIAPLVFFNVYLIICMLSHPYYDKKAYTVMVNNSTNNINKMNNHLSPFTSIKWSKFRRWYNTYVYKCLSFSIIYMFVVDIILTCCLTMRECFKIFTD